MPRRRSQRSDSPLLALGNEGQWRPSNSTSDINLLADAIARLSAKDKNTAALPAFTGEPEDDPEDFLRKLREYFSARDEQPDVQTAGKCLTGPAAAWLTRNPQYIYDDFETSIREAYNGRATRSRLLRDLYGRPQAIDEPVTSFLQRKERLCRRLQPEMADNPDFVAVLQDLVLPHLGAMLDLNPPTDLAQLKQMAGRVEARAATRESTPATAQQTKRLPKCRFCPGYHYHRDCEEARRQGRSQVAPPPSEN